MNLVIKAKNELKFKSIYTNIKCVFICEDEETNTYTIWIYYFDPIDKIISHEEISDEVHTYREAEEIIDRIFEEAKNNNGFVDMDKVII